jgi:ABC-2 type transport system ATP-binding protein
MSTHTLDVVEEVCDRVLVMGRGRLVADGTVQELRARLPTAGEGGGPPTLEDLFIALTGASDEVSDPAARRPDREPKGA